MKKTIYMETTTKSVEHTIMEIQKLLIGLGVKDVFINYDEDGNVEAMSFSVRTGSGAVIPFRLPSNHMALWEMARNNQTKYIKTEEQARRVAWRQVYRWVQAQIALIEIGMARTEEVFLPYILIDGKKTLYDKYSEGGFKALYGKTEAYND